FVAAVSRRDIAGAGAHAGAWSATAGARTTTASAGAAAAVTVTARAARATALFAFGARRRVQRRRVGAAERIALVDPHLHADHAVCRLGFGEAVVDVGAQGVQRHAAFAVPLGAGDLDAVQA